MLTRPISSHEFKSIYSRVPRLCVDIALQNKDGVLLTLRRLPTWHKWWHLPGGTVFYKERLAQAVRRIARRELGIAVKVVKFLGYYECDSEIKQRGYGWSVSLVFQCRTAAKTIKVNEEAYEARFFKRYPKRFLAEQRNFLKKYFK
jgi:colanic acid biosynthesis protein WcaH